MSVREFRKKGYTVVKGAVTPELRDVITQYALFDEMQDFTPDGQQVPNAHSKYADPAMETMLLHLHSKVERRTGLTLHPTYSFYRVYRNGDELKPHTDRPSCEISATVCFNYSYYHYDNSGYDEYGAQSARESYEWPIYMDGARIVMSPGDMVIYRGIDLQHWREPFSPPGDDWHVQAFFHYVDANGPHADYKYDKRTSIGMLHKLTNKKKYITEIL